MNYRCVVITLSCSFLRNLWDSRSTFSDLSKNLNPGSLMSLIVGPLTLLGAIRGFKVGGKIGSSFIPGVQKGYLYKIDRPIFS